MGGVAPICRWLIAVNVAVFIVQILTLRNEDGGATGWFLLRPDRVFGHFEIWRLVTYAFCHAPRDPLHVLFNMWFLWMMGSQVEPIYGPREFLRFYLTAAVFAALCYLGFGFIVSRPAPMYGASGAVMAVTMLCALYYPTQKILVLFVFPLELRWLVALYAFYDAYPLIQEIGGEGAMSQVAHAAHLGGLLYGYLYKKFDLRFTRLMGGPGGGFFSQWLRRLPVGRRAKVRLYEPPADRSRPVDMDQKVDEILAKISAHGEASLTDSEREILKEASRRYKRH
jgi:membrane associated rhomboid family serine protease